MNIRYRLYGMAGESDELLDAMAPRVGHYLMSALGRGAYLVLGVKDRGKRGGLGEPVHRLYVLDVERVPRADGEAAAEAGLCHSIAWDSRRRKPRRLASLAP